MATNNGGSPATSSTQAVLIARQATAHKAHSSAQLWAPEPAEFHFVMAVFCGAVADLHKEIMNGLLIY